MRARTVDKRDGFDPAFIDIFEQVLEVYGFPNVEDLSGRKQKGGRGHESAQPRSCSVLSGRSF